MKITNVKVKKLEEKENSRLIGSASIVIDNEFKVSGIKIIKGNSRIFAAMPSEKMPDNTFKDIAHPVNMECRQKLEEAILTEFRKISEENE